MAFPPPLLFISAAGRAKGFLPRRRRAHKPTALLFVLYGMLSCGIPQAKVRRLHDDLFEHKIVVIVHNQTSLRHERSARLTTRYKAPF
jgi:hypothetical protein